MIHTKKMILKAYTTIQESKILSLYEVLWAAKVELDPETLQPIRKETNETSVNELYFMS